MDGNQLPPPLPERSPWARPAEGGPAVEFELRPAHDAEPAVSAAKRPWKLVGAAVIVAMVAVAGALVAIRGNGSGDSEAAGTQQIQPAPVDESNDDPVATTAPTTAAPATTAPPAPTTAVATTVSEASAPPSTIGTIEVEPGTYSLEGTYAHPPYPMRVTMNMGSLGETVVVSAEVDASERMHMTLDTGTAGEFEAIFDVPGGIGYMRGESFSPLQTTDAAWIAIDLEHMLSFSGLSYEAFRDSFSARPDFEALSAITTPTPLGLTEIDGESVMLYHFTLDGSDLHAAADAAAIADSFLFEGLGSWEGAITYRLYVTEDSRLRRMEMDMDVDGEILETVMTFHPVELDFEVLVPDQSVVELIDITQLAG